MFADKRFAQPIPPWIGVLTPFMPLMTYMIGDRGVSANFRTHRTAERGPCSRTVSLHFRSVPPLRQRCAESLCVAAAQRINCRRALRQNTESRLFGEVLIYGGFAVVAGIGGQCSSDGSCPLFAIYVGKTGRCLFALGPRRAPDDEKAVAMVIWQSRLRFASSAGCGGAMGTPGHL